MRSVLALPKEAMKLPLQQGLVVRSASLTGFFKLTSNCSLPLSAMHLERLKLFSRLSTLFMSHKESSGYDQGAFHSKFRAVVARG